MSVHWAISLGGLGWTDVWGILTSSRETPLLNLRGALKSYTHHIFRSTSAYVYKGPTHTSFCRHKLPDEAVTHFRVFAPFDTKTSVKHSHSFKKLSWAHARGGGTNPGDFAVVIFLTLCLWSSFRKKIRGKGYKCSSRLGMRIEWSTDVEITC